MGYYRIRPHSASIANRNRANEPSTNTYINIVPNNGASFYTRNAFNTYCQLSTTMEIAPNASFRTDENTVGMVNYETIANFSIT